MGKDWAIHDNGVGESDNLLTGTVGFSFSSEAGEISSPSSASAGVGLNCIHHRVSKFDTLAGVAIRYGVEVADIKRLNGLVSDLQMFALKTLQIPLPGKHPPSPSLINGQDTTHGGSSSYQSPSSSGHLDLFGSFQSLKLKSSSERRASPAMSSLQGYYGLRSINQQAATEAFEMAVYRKAGASYLEDGLFLKSSPVVNPPLSLHRKSKSVANGLFSEKGNMINQILQQEAGDSDSDRLTETLARRRQKSEADFTCRTPEMLLKEENSSSAVSAITGKGLALRPKSASRTVSGVDGEGGGLTSIPLGSGNSLVADSVNGFRKSSSTSSLQDTENGSLSSIWPTSKWSLKPDFQALSTAAITRPIFDGLPLPMGRKNKTAVD
ncbi:Peptidoglycan-binding LysM domain-containing protein isoform 1 [Dorcoceras hygrometricum]|uniref:Peptidoglycan-binding LysM domain-containing protein isoform 1 n=1 Tax=Dorcoceras hygrometricum TaxID=472368 RepID=A0A2Z7DDJ4_9LAMI|nr:Peptidoglycan-binding LysM domain-containing protein isoform 1 [Dorcoceras hygrometricum]